MSLQVDAMASTSRILSSYLNDPSRSGFEDQVRRKRPRIGYALPVVALLAKSRLGIWLMLVVLTFLYPGPWFARSGREIYSVALTGNNARAINRLADAMGEDASKIRPNTYPLPLRERLVALQSAWEISGVGSRFDQPTAFVFLNQMLAAVSIMLFWRNLTQSQPQAVVVANDHSPAAVALIALTREMKLPCVYVQHGPVSESFPPLTVDLAILHNLISKDRYDVASNRIGGSRPSRVAILPPFREPSCPIRRPIAPYDICIALSFFPDIPQISALVDVLRDRADVATITISRHPRCVADLSALAGQGVVIVDKRTSTQVIARGVDLCIVANSGVGLEYLHEGCPTFDLAPSDPVLDDYYGFVAAGLLTRFELGLLDQPSRISAAFDLEWQERFAQFDPTLTQSVADLESHVRAEVLALLARS